MPDRVKIRGEFDKWREKLNFSAKTMAGNEFDGHLNEVREQVDLRVLNLDHLAQYTANDAGLESELLGLFKDQAVLQFENIQSADCKDDWEMAVHTLKGSARGIGAGQVAVLSVDLEIVGFAGTATEKQAATNKLKQAVAVCVAAIETLI